MQIALRTISETANTLLIVLNFITSKAENIIHFKYLQSKLNYLCYSEYAPVNVTSSLLKVDKKYWNNSAGQQDHWREGMGIIILGRDPSSDRESRERQTRDMEGFGVKTTDQSIR